MQKVEKKRIRESDYDIAEYDEARGGR